MKKKFSCLALCAIIVGQLSWLGYNYHARSVELATAPSLIVECDALDPRDFFRGDYVSFDCGMSYPITHPALRDVLHWPELRPDDEVEYFDHSQAEVRKFTPQEVQPIPARPATNPASVELKWGEYHNLYGLIGYWLPADKGVAQLVRVVNSGGADDVPREGEIRTALNGWLTYSIEEKDGKPVAAANVRLYLCVSEEFKRVNMRYYVPENMGDVRRAWYRTNCGSDNPFPFDRIRCTVELVCRGRNGLMVRQLYLNGVPWVEAIRQIQDGSFLTENGGDGQ